MVDLPAPLSPVSHTMTPGSPGEELITLYFCIVSGVARRRAYFEHKFGRNAGATTIYT